MPRFEPHPERRPALITGASSGIGEATARALAAAGHPVVLGARRADRCETIANEISSAGGEAYAARVDLTDEASMKDFVEAATGAVGTVEILVSNAGDSAIGTVVETSPDEFARQVEVNLLGAQRLVSLAVPAMIERARGDIVFVTSEAVQAPWPGVAAYVASKWGLEGLARVMQRELEGTGVRASIVRPGPTLTEMGSSWDPSGVGGVVEGFKRWGMLRHGGLLRPAQVARVIVDIVSMPRGSHVSMVEVQPEAPVRSEGVRDS
jgi:NADP-dependent 3-hydroxy acid dehydrogenase YdfG